MAQMASLAVYIYFMIPLSTIGVSGCGEAISAGFTWPLTASGATKELNCVSGYGNASRRCSDQSVWEDINEVDCSTEELTRLKEQWLNSSGNASPEFVESLRVIATSSFGTSGELMDTVDLITNLITSKPLTNSYEEAILVTMTENILTTVDRTVDSGLTLQWANLHQFESGSTFLSYLESIRRFSDDVLAFLSRSNRTTLRYSLNYIESVYQVQPRSSVEDFSINTNSANVIIPRRSFNKYDSNDMIGVAVLQFRENMRNLLPSPSILPSLNYDSSAITSALLSVSQYPPQSHKLLQEHQVQLVMKTSRFNLTSCGLLNFSSSDSLWEKNICTVKSVAENDVSCLCDTLSIYAVIDTVPRSLPQIVLAVLVLTEFLLWLTILMLIFANRKLESDRALVVKCFLLTMSATHITLMAGLYSVHNADVCTGVALLLHFFELSEAFWLLGMVVQLVLKVTYKTTDSGSVSQYMALGWITPLFVVASTAGLEISQYGTEYYCFLNIEDEIFSAFAVPAALIVGTSFICLTYISYTYFMIRKKNRKVHRRLILIFPNIRASFVACVTLVLDWTATALSLTFYGPVTMTFFTLLKFTEAFCIFLLFGVFSSEVKHEYEKRFGICWPNRRKKMNNDRPETNDELSQIRESSVIHDLDSTISSTGPLSAYNRAPSSMSNGGFNSTTSLRKADFNGNANGINPFITRGLESNGSRPIVNTVNTGDSKAGTSGVSDDSARNSPQESTPMTSFRGLSLKHKLKVFPLLKHDEEREDSSTT